MTLDLAALSHRTVLVTGAGGMLGSAFREVLETIPHCRVVSLDRAALDVTDPVAVMALVRERPDVILHCAADVDADRCERDPDRCNAIQVGGTVNVIALAKATGARVVYPQSVFIFDGEELPVTERTTPNPLSAYGRAKWEAEQRLVAELPQSLVIRMAGFFGGDARDKNFVGKFTRQLMELVARHERTCEVGERIWQPTYTRDLAENTLFLLARGCVGVYHMGSLDEASFSEVASACIEDLGLSELMTVRVLSPAERMALERAPRPFRIITANARLRAEGLDRQRHWRVALKEYLSRPFFQARARAAAGSLR